MRSTRTMLSLKQSGVSKYRKDAVPCVALLHNEENILPDFLEHYRALGEVSFFIVDDRSTDASREILSAAPDVTVFEPKPGQTYVEHRTLWYSDLLDRFAADRWALVPDIDEHFVHAGMERRGLETLIRSLEEEKAEALFTLMVDMYADRPLEDHVYRGGGLRRAFPLFDGPAPAPYGYRLLCPARRFLQKWPTPPVMAHGGFRERLFFSRLETASRFQCRLMDRFAHLGRPLEPGPVDRFFNRRIAQRAIRGLHDRPPLSSTKLGLLKWRRGMRFSGGPHMVSERLRLSGQIAAFLHYPITRGIDGVNYIVERGQHDVVSSFNRKMLDSRELLAHSPVFEYTRRYEDSGSLSGLIR